jgi:hypothetical protein
LIVDLFPQEGILRQGIFSLPGHFIHGTFLNDRLSGLVQHEQRRTSSLLKQKLSNTYTKDFFIVDDIMDFNDL